MKHQQPLVSVLMPVYNASMHLNEAVDSILSQSYKNYEFIIIDDGSNDNTLNILRKYRDKRIIIIKHKKNKGIVTSLNEGIQTAKGKYIVRMDADDISLKNRIKIQVSYMENHPQVGVCATWISVFGGEKEYVWKTPISHNDIFARTLFETPIAHPSVIIRKELLDKFRLKYQKKYKYAEDYKLWIDVGKVSKLHSYPKVLLKYRVHASQTGSSKRNLQIKASSLIRKKQLISLGIKPTKKELRLHELLCNWKDIKNFTSLKKWLNKISQANKISRVYNQSSLQAILIEKWTGLIRMYKKNFIERVFLVLFPGRHIPKKKIWNLIKKQIIK